MNTTAAAAQAGVTVATIRAWARRGVIAATKTAGRWILDAASLAHRIAIGILKRRTQREAPVTEVTPAADRKAVRAANKAAANEARTRVLAAITAAGLPLLSGTDKQIAWAEDIRSNLIEAALHNLAGTHLGVHYSLTNTLTEDPLRTSRIPGLRPWDTGSEYASEADLLAALTTAVTYQGAGAAHEDRTQAAWWIEHR